MATASSLLSQNPLPTLQLKTRLYPRLSPTRPSFDCFRVRTKSFKTLSTVRCSFPANNVSIRHTETKRNPFEILAESLMSALKKTAAAALLVGFLLMYNPNSAFAAGSGGRMGGRCFSSRSSSSRSYSAPKKRYSSSSWSYSAPKKSSSSSSSLISSVFTIFNALEEISSSSSSRSYSAPKKRSSSSSSEIVSLLNHLIKALEEISSSSSSCSAPEISSPSSSKSYSAPETGSSPSSRISSSLSSRYSAPEISSPSSSKSYSEQKTRSSPSSSSYSAPETSSSSSSGSYSTPETSSSSPSSDSSPETLAAAVTIALLVLSTFAVFFFVSVCTSDGSEKGSVRTAIVKASVIKLQVGLLGSGRSVLKHLNRIAETADTSTQEGLHYVLTETVLVLLRHPDYFISAYSSVDLEKSLEGGEKTFNRLSIEERGKFEEETLVNIDNIKKQSSTRQRGSELSNEYIVVTILVAADGEHGLPSINNSTDLKEALQNLASIPSSRTMAVEVLWTPQNEDDTLSERELLEDYSSLRPL